MDILIKGKTVELKYTFNSFKYMGELDLSALGDLESKPFKIIGLLETLLLGAVNNNPKVRIYLVDVQAFIEVYAEEGSITELLEELMSKLQESTFFKALQKKTK